LRVPVLAAIHGRQDRCTWPGRCRTDRGAVQCVGAGDGAEIGNTWREHSSAPGRSPVARLNDAWFACGRIEGTHRLTIET
jgi:hypothetical protein